MCVIAHGLAMQNVTMSVQASLNILLQQYTVKPVYFVSNFRNLSIITLTMIEQLCSVKQKHAKYKHKHK